MHNAVNRVIFSQVGNLHTANQPNGTKTRESERESRWNNVVQNIKINQFIDHSLSH